MTEVEQMWQLKDQNQGTRMSVIAETQSLAKYAGAAVFAPMIFTIPFPTMVETPDQEIARTLHGAMFVKNIMSYFTIMAILSLLIPIIPGFNKWRDHVLIEVFLIAYLVILVFSAFAHADRFHLPALALEILFMAYGVSISRIPQLQRWFKYWVALAITKQPKAVVMMQSSSRTQSPLRTAVPILYNISRIITPPCRYLV